MLYFEDATLGQLEWLLGLVPQMQPNWVARLIRWANGEAMQDTWAKNFVKDHNL
jgi:hypothetical protein